MMKLLVILLLGTQLTWAQSLVSSGPSSSPSNPRPEMWPDRMWSSISKEVDKSGSQITNIIFDLVDDNAIDIFSNNNNKLKGLIQRKVFDNQDVMGTWTVSDSFGFDLSRAATEFTFPLIPSATNPVNFNLGVGGRLVVTHVRQVSSSKYPDMPRIEEIQQELEKTLIYEKKENKWFSFDPSIRPRFGTFWNLLTAPFKIPWNKDLLGNIKSGELISYSGSGYVSVGLEAGFLPLKVHEKVDLNLGVGVQTFLKGEFRITVLKESDRYVRVKLTKIRSHGFGFTAGAKTNDVQVYEGFMVAGIDTGPIEVSIVPFKFSADRETKKQYDLGYRFDLENEEAEEAYEKAMLGNFHFAEEKAKTNKAITSILSRDALEKRKTTSYKLGMSWLINTGRKREKKNQWVTIEQPSGKKEIFKSSFELLKQWGTFWGDGEKRDFLFSTILDRTAYEGHEDNSYQLISEALIEDVRTSGKEMQRYIRDVEAIIGDNTVLPELPLLVPKEESHKMKKASYKRSSFYFGQYFSQKQVMKFLMTPPDKAWEISYKSFDYVINPLNRGGKVRRFYNHWMRLQEKFKKIMTTDELVDALQDLRRIFRYHSRAIHVMRAILMSLDGEDIDYFLTATNNSFGRVQFRGRVTTNAERLMQLADETIDFENQVGNARPNPNAQLKNLVVEEVNDDIKITFDLPQDTKYMFFRILRSSGWKKVKNLKELIFVNKDRFKTGPNSWLIRRHSLDMLDMALYEVFKTPDYYTFQLSVSLDRQTWGRVESSRFRFTPYVTPEENNMTRNKPKSTQESL